jgi:hypothetical protein
MMTRAFFVLAFVLSAVIDCGSPVVAAPGQGVSQDTIAARARFFGSENVDAVGGEVRADRVIVAAALSRCVLVGSLMTQSGHAHQLDPDQCWSAYLG